jgi:hypothetical protein
MAHIIPNEQHCKRVLYSIALTRYKEKQFTGCPAKVQLNAEVTIHFVDFDGLTTKETRSSHGLAILAGGVAATLRSRSEKVGQNFGAPIAFAASVDAGVFAGFDACVDALRRFLLR